MLGGRPAAYHDCPKPLQRKDSDAVIVATPGHWHVLPAIHACQAGKDLFVRKALDTSIGEGRAAAKAVRKYDCIVQIGTQQYSWSHYREAVGPIPSGLPGEISHVLFWDLEKPKSRIRLTPR